MAAALLLSSMGEEERLHFDSTFSYCAGSSIPHFRFVP
jgi:hypothetical protein